VDDKLSSLLTAIESEVKLVLRDAQIYDIYSYGWINENDADPDMLGHAMWQVDQPELDHNAIFGESPVHRRPAEVEKHIMTIGEDFCGLVEASRLSIGLALGWARRAKLNFFSESSYFWLHHTDAFLKLAIASDRLRDLLIVACTGDAPELYKKVKKRNRLYVTPFNDAEQLLSARGIQDERLDRPLESLAQEAADIFVRVDRRNSIVHEIATRMAKYVQGTVSELQLQYDDEQAKGFKAKPRTPGDWLSGAKARTNELEAEIDMATDEIRDWYLLLISASNNVFQVEYWSRKLGNR
jgi:hypothetical protein